MFAPLIEIGLQIISRTPALNTNSISYRCPDVAHSQLARCPGKVPQEGQGLESLIRH